MKIDDIVNAIKADKRDRHPILIGIEGYGGSGKSTIASQLAELLGDTSTINMDDFIIKENITNNDWDKQAFDRKRLEYQILKPATEGRPIAYEKLLWDTNTLSEPITVKDTDYLIVEGISCYHPSIVKYYDYKIWVDVPIETAKSRGKARDAGNENEKHWDMWAENDLAYQQKYHPEQVADFVITN